MEYSPAEGYMEPQSHCIVDQNGRNMSKPPIISQVPFVSVREGMMMLSVSALIFPMFRALKEQERPHPEVCRAEMVKGSAALTTLCSRYRNPSAKVARRRASAGVNQLLLATGKRLAEMLCRRELRAPRLSAGPMHVWLMWERG